MVVEAGRRDSPSIFRLSEPGCRHQQRGRSILALPQAPGHLKSIHLGHADVKQDNVGSHVLGGRQRGGPIVGHHDFMLLKAKHLRQGFGGIDVVINDQNALSLRLMPQGADGSIAITRRGGSVGGTRQAVDDRTVMATLGYRI